MYRHLAGLLCAFFLALGLDATTANAAANRWTNALGGNWNVAGNWSGGIPVATDTAVIDLAGDYTVTMNVNPTIAALRISGSTSGVQKLVAASRAIALPNASSIGAQAVCSLSVCTVSGAGAITNEGTLIVGNGTTTLGNPYSNASGATLRVSGTGAASLTVASGFTNDGAIVLTSFGNVAATLTVTSPGTLTNAASATISALVGGGGARTLAAKLANAGTITIGANTSTNVASVDHVNTGTIDVTGGNYTVTLSGTTPSFTMTGGAINVASGRTLNLNGTVAPGTNQVYQYDGGTLGGAGAISMTNATLALGTGLATGTAHLALDDCTVNGPGTLTVSTGTTLNPLFSTTGSTISAPVVIESGGTLTLTSSDQLGTLDNSGTFNATGSSTSSGSITTQPGSVIRVYGGTFTVNNSFTNSAAIELTSQAINTSAILSMPVAATLTNAASGTITAIAGPGGGSRQLNAEYNNAGTITVSGSNLITSVASADHVNSGTIDVTGGNYTVTLSGTAPSFTMTGGAINVASGRTLNLNGTVAPGTNQVYQYNGGTLGGAGTISMTSATLALGTGLATGTAHLALDDCTVNGPGTLTVSTGTTLNPLFSTTGSTISAPVVIESGGTLTLTSSDQLGTLDNSGTFNATGSSTSSGSITTQPGSVIRVYGGTFTVNNSFTNSAAIELTSQTINTSAILSMPAAATLTNAASGTITAIAGPGGGNRQLNAEYNNAGTITVSGSNLITSVASADHVNSGTIDVTGGNYTLTLSGTTPTFATTGTISVASGRTLSLNGPVGTVNSLYNYNAGTLGGAGTVSVNDATLALNVAMNTNATHLDPANCVINGPSTLTVSNGTTLTATGSVLNCPVMVEGGATFDLNTSTLGGSITNGGTWLIHGVCPVTSTNITTDPGSVIRIEGNGATGWMQVSTGFTNDSAIELTSAASGQARLDVTSGILVNTTYATISALVGGGGSRVLNANVTNVGTITVAATMSGTMTPTNILNTGTIDLTTGNWTHTMGGSTGSFTNTGIINIPVGRTLALNGNPGVVRGAGLNYNLNSGSIISGGGILSATHSTLKFNIPYFASFADIKGDSATFAGPDTLYITAGDSAHVFGSAFSGPVVVQSGGKLSINSCDITGETRTAGLIEVIAINDVTGPFTSLGGSSIQIVGISTTQARLRFPSGFTNHGVIDLTSRAAAGTSILETTTGTITNSPTGTINVEFAVGGARQILGTFSNAGQLNVMANLTVLEAGAAHVNSGTVSIDATRALTVSGATFTNQASGVLGGSGALHLSLTTFTQEGKIAPGASPGTLSIIRPGTQLTFPITYGATASFDVEVGGDAAGTGYDQVILEDPVTLDGALNISVINDYLPQPGRRYVIATFPSRTGTFSSVTGLEHGIGKMWAVAYSDTDVVLLAMDQTWSRALPDGAPPSARDGHSAAYDPAGDRMMVFGGQSDAGVLNDTWVLSKAVGLSYPAWTALATTGATPGHRRDATAVYAPASNRLIVFGGADAAGTATFGDVRVLTNANGVGGAPTWSALSPTGTPPSARSGHAAAYDAANDRMIVMGGDATPNACGGELADVWVLSNASGASGTPAWTELSPTGGPPTVRAHHGAAYDVATGRLIIVGGDACAVANTETWTLSEANGLGGTPAWTMLAPTQPAPANWSLARYALDESLNWLDAFGGMVGATPVDTAFTLTHANGDGSSSWHRRLFYGDRPAPRTFHSMVLASASHTAVVFGGMTATGRTNDVWRRLLDKGPVLDVEPPVVVPTRTAFALPPSPNPAPGPVSMAVDVAREQAVDLAVFDLAGRRVATLHTGRLPAGRHTFEWAARRSGPAAPGVYLVRLKADERTQIVRVVRL